MGHLPSAFVTKWASCVRDYTDWRDEHPNATLAECYDKEYELITLPVHTFWQQTDGGNPEGPPPPPPPQ